MGGNDGVPAVDGNGAFRRRITNNIQPLLYKEDT